MGTLFHVHQHHIPPNNGVIHNNAQVIKHVMSSAMEAKRALFISSKLATQLFSFYLLLLVNIIVICHYSCLQLSLFFPFWFCYYVFFLCVAVRPRRKKMSGVILPRLKDNNSIYSQKTEVFSFEMLIGKP